MLNLPLYYAINVIYATINMTYSHYNGCNHKVYLITCVMSDGCVMSHGLLMQEKTHSNVVSVNVMHYGMGHVRCMLLKNLTNLVR